METPASEARKVLLAGKIGSGKTYLLNKVCGTTFASAMCAKSCTRAVQWGQSGCHGITIIDSPGFYSSEEITAHTDHQRMAMERNELSGIYVVVKFGRSDEMAETLNKILDFVGDGDHIRIIITHCDLSIQQDQVVDVNAIMERLSKLVDVELHHIIAVGKHSSAEEIENFIASTLHAPVKHELSEIQLASVDDHCVGARKFIKPIQEIREKIDTATIACHELSKSNLAEERDAAIHLTRQVARAMVDDGKLSILEAARELTVEQQYILDQEINRSVSTPLQNFLHSTIRSELANNNWEPNSFRRAWKPTPWGGLEVKFVKDKDSPHWRVLYVLENIEISSVEKVPGQLREKKVTAAQSKTGKRRRESNSDNRKGFEPHSKAANSAKAAPARTAKVPSSKKRKPREDAQAVSSSHQSKGREGGRRRNHDGHTPPQTIPKNQVPEERFATCGENQACRLPEPVVRSRNASATVTAHHQEEDSMSTWWKYAAWFCTVVCICFAVDKAHPEKVFSDSDADKNL